MIGARIIGAELVVKKFAAVPKAFEPEVLRAVTRCAIRLQSYIKINKLTGDPLNVRTGTLRRSITYVVTQELGRTTGTVGTIVKYGAAHEFGFHGTVNVRAHIRKVKSRNKTEVITGKNGKTKEKLTAQGIGFVKAHSRQMDLPERSFLRSSLRELGPSITAELELALNKILGGF